MLDRHVYLIGMPGSGKTSICRKAAANLRLPCVDMDARISEWMGCTIPEIFSAYGEEAFRHAETNLLIRLASEKPALISTGGGTVIRPLNLQLMRASGVIVFNDRPLASIVGDIRTDRRPLLTDRGAEEVERLYHERIDIYRSAADEVIDNAHGFYAAVAALEQILHQYGA